MRKIYKVIGGMLVAGALVAGIGSGVAFAEYSSFEYGGEVMLEGSERFTKTVEYKVSEKIDVLNIMTDVHGGYNYTVVEDTAVSKDKIQVMVSYLSDDKNVTPEVIQIQGENSEKTDEYMDVESKTTEEPDESMDEESGEAEETSESTEVESKTIQNESKNLGKTYEYIYVGCNYQYNDFRDIMRVKDLILADLKNHKINDYQLDKVEKIEIHINPKADFTIQSGEDSAY